MGRRSRERERIDNSPSLPVTKEAIHTSSCSSERPFGLRSKKREQKEDRSSYKARKESRRMDFEISREAS